jgi:hypothetical protein
MSDVKKAYKSITKIVNNKYLELIKVKRNIRK